LSTVSFTVTIEAQAKDTGEVRSSRKVQGAEELPSGGLIQANHVILVEALRSECYLMLLSKISLGDSLEKVTPKSLEGEVLSHLMESIRRLLPEVSAETIKRTL
jgi:hypothetical protein